MMSKRIFGIALVLSMLLSVCVFVGADAAIGIDHEEQVSKLNAFGILSGYPDAGYKADAQVTAKDFVNAACKLAGGNDDAAASMEEKFGFKTEDNSITVLNAAAVLLTAIDYSYEAETYGGYPNGYSRTASRHKLFSGIGLSLDDKLTNDAMAVMLYNALDMDLPEIIYSSSGSKASRSGITVLENMDIYKGEGIVTGNSYASMNGCAEASGDNIIINNEKAYSLGKTYADELFGYFVEFYYNDEDELLWIDAGSGMNIVKTAENDITTLDSSRMVYTTDNGRKKTVSFESPTFVYNGKTVQNPDLKSFIPVSGYIVTIDNDGDGKAEVVKCESYEYYLVSSKNTADNSIGDFEAATKLSLLEDDYDSMKITKNGLEIVFADINTDDVLAVMRSDEKGGVLRAVVSEHMPVSGSINAISDEEIQIDGTSYKISTAYVGNKLTINSEGMFYFDVNGHVVRFSRGKNTVSKYAYLIAAYVDEAVGDCYMKILTAGGTVEVRKVCDRVRNNNQTITPEKLYSLMLNDGAVEKQLITYTLNSSGYLNRVETASRDNLYSGSDEESADFSIYFTGHGRYRKNNMCFNSKYLIEADTPIFVVPSSRKSEDYEVLYAQSLVNGTSYYISVYDIDKYMTAGAIVLDEVASEPEQLKSKRSILVEEIAAGLNNDGDDIAIVTGYQQGSKVTLKTKDTKTLRDSDGRYYSIGNIDGCIQLSRGDVIQTSLDASGNLLAFRTLYKADETRKKLVVASNDSPNEYEEGGNVNEFADLFVLSGQVVARSDSVLVVKSDTKRAHKITNGVSVYMVGGRGIEKVSADDIHAYDEVYLHTYQGNLQEVIIYNN